MKNVTVVLVQDRAQQNELLLAVDPGTGQTREVRLVALAGKREVYGFRGDVMGKV